METEMVMKFDESTFKNKHKNKATEPRTQDVPKEPSPTAEEEKKNPNKYNSSSIKL